MSRVKIYNERVTHEPDGRPTPANRVEEYECNNTWRVVWGTGDSWPIQVKRANDDTPEDTWFFAVDVDKDDPYPRTARVAPIKHVYNPLEKRSDGRVVHRYSPPARRPQTKKRTITLDDVPEAVLKVLENNEYITVVETLG